LKPEAWEDYRRRSCKWRVRIEYELLHSEAFKSIQYAPAIKVLIWMFEKRIVRKTTSRKNRFIDIDEPFSFPYEEGRRRGLTHKQFGRAIRELFERGFIDLEKQGSGMHKDFSLYRLSSQWKRFGTTDFERREFPKRPNFGCFGEPKRRRKQGQRTAVEQRPISAVENASQRAISAVENPVS